MYVCSLSSILTHSNPFLKSSDLCCTGVTITTPQILEQVAREQSIELQEEVIDSYF